MVIARRGSFQRFVPSGLSTAVVASGEAMGAGVELAGAGMPGSREDYARLAQRQKESSRRRV